MELQKKNKLWFVTGSQHLYGPETLKQVSRNSAIIVDFLNSLKHLSADVEFKAVVTTPDEILAVCSAANGAEECIGLVFWMHTFSPAKMWIAGLTTLSKPFVHLHTQFNKEIPWKEIDMDFMNLNQSAHGDREFGYICTRLNKTRKVIVGHWKDPEVLEGLESWIRAAAGFREFKSLKVARIGDNMREVAVTEGDKVDAQIRFGFSVNGYGISDLVKFVNQVKEEEIDKLINEYKDQYIIDQSIFSEPEMLKQLRSAAKIELALRNFLKTGGFKAFTTTFEDLEGLDQLPGLAVQRLMADGYGFGAEGDWKTAALLRAFKVMASDSKKGTSFMEDYTYHFSDKDDLVLGAHMLEVCSSLAKDKPRLEIHPLSIGGKDDPARLIFEGKPGRAYNISMVDMGYDFRLIVNAVEAVDKIADMPNLPVASVLWKPLPNLKTAAKAWIYAGGAHHTVYTQDVSIETIKDFASMIELDPIIIDENTDPEFLN
jgi:L-arabinose isomerase